MIRTVVTNAQWRKMEPHCLGKASDPGRTGSDNRMFIEAVLWVERDVFKRIFDAVSDDDMEYAMINATIVKVRIPMKLNADSDRR